MSISASPIDGVTPGQKQRLIAGVTQLLVDVLARDPTTTVVVIDEVNTDNLGFAGERVTACRQQDTEGSLVRG